MRASSAPLARRALTYYPADAQGAFSPKKFANVQNGELTPNEVERNLMTMYDEAAEEWHVRPSRSPRKEKGVEALRLRRRRLRRLGTLRRWHAHVQQRRQQRLLLRLLLPRWVMMRTTRRTTRRRVRWR